MADHIRSAVFILGDSNAVAPSNTSQGYVLRRLIRRAIRFGKKININQNFVTTLAGVVIKNYEKAYARLEENSKFILDEWRKEENKFLQTLEKGQKELQKQKNNDGQTVFVLISA